MDINGKRIFNLIVMNFVCVYVNVTCMGVPREIRKGCQILLGPKFN